MSSEKYTDHFSVCLGYSTSLLFLTLPLSRMHFVCFIALIAPGKNGLKEQTHEEYVSVHSFPNGTAPLLARAPTYHEFSY